jgi:hypothetical protein
VLHYAYSGEVKRRADLVATVSPRVGMAEVKKYNWYGVSEKLYRTSVLLLVPALRSRTKIVLEE